MSFRLPVDLVHRLRAFLRDHSGKPLYLESGTFAAEALERHLVYTQRKLDAAIDLNHRQRVTPPKP